MDNSSLITTATVSSTATNYQQCAALVPADSKIGYAEVCVELCAQPTVVENVVECCRGVGIVVKEDGQGLFENNTIQNAAAEGVVICSGGDAVFNGNKIHSCKGTGILCFSNGRSKFVGNNVEIQTNFHIIS